MWRRLRLICLGYIKSSISSFTYNIKRKREDKMVKATLIIMAAGIGS